MSTGGGYSKLNETMSTLGVPVMSPNNFICTERGIGQWWQEHLKDVMAEAGREEKQLAEERDDYHQGVPCITVIVDGGWSKRSHRHSYNAKSRGGIIIGQATGKILHIGVRNKYCTACTQGVSPNQHICFKNWNESSSQMESDIILEGFKQSEEVHGVRYIRFIGDGDSSVYMECAINIVPLALKGCLQTNTFVLRIGMSLPHKWRVTLSWKDSSSPRKYMVSGTFGSLEMVIAVCTSL